MHLLPALFCITRNWNQNIISISVLKGGQINLRQQKRQEMEKPGSNLRGDLTASQKKREERKKNYSRFWSFIYAICTTGEKHDPAQHVCKK